VREARDAIIAAHGNSMALASFHVLFEMTGWGERSLRETLHSVA
jgi:hypothetical protein